LRFGYHLLMRCHAVAVVALAACGRIGFEPLATEDLEVGPAYASAPTWSSWIRNSDPTLPAWAQPEIACDGSEQGFAGCVHAGEMRRAATTLSTCDGLSIDDTLGALQWTCVDDGGSIAIVATGLMPGHGLRHLVNASGWIPDAVEVRRGGQLIASSKPAAWWTDPVVAAPTSGQSVSLAQSGTVYVVVGTQLSHGYALDADGIAFVVLPGGTLVASPPFGNNCDFALGDGTMTACMIVAANHRFSWIEGDLDAASVAGVGVMLVNQAFARVRAVRATSAGFDIALQTTTQSAVVDTVVVEGGQFGLQIHGGHDNAVVGLTASDCGHGGNQGAAGLYLANTTNNTISRVLATSDNEYGIFPFGGAVANTVAHVTVANDDYDGVSSNDTGNVIAQVAAASIGGAGVELYTESRGMQLVSANNGTGVKTDTDPPELSGAIVVGANTQDCDLKVGSAYTNSCTPISTSASVVTGIDLTGALRAAVTTDDAANASDASGAAPRAAITDWFHFDDPSRAWGEDGPWPGAHTMCVTNCRIWDWRRTSGDTMLIARDRFGVASDEPLVPGQPCPPRLDGDNAAMDASSRYFLLGAVELLGDGIGNDDGLCQSGEVCLDLRTAGAHRDELTTWTSTGCVFHDGMVTGVDVRGTP
jgi:hypothetical protein